jgi:hypothetical protein
MKGYKNQKETMRTAKDWLQQLTTMFQQSYYGLKLLDSLLILLIFFSPIVVFFLLLWRGSPSFETFEFRGGNEKFQASLPLFFASLDTATTTAVWRNEGAGSVSSRKI